MLSRILTTLQLLFLPMLLLIVFSVLLTQESRLSASLLIELNELHRRGHLDSIQFQEYLDSIEKLADKNLQSEELQEIAVKHPSIQLFELDPKPCLLSSNSIPSVHCLKAPDNIGSEQFSLFTFSRNLAVLKEFAPNYAKVFSNLESAESSEELQEIQLGKMQWITFKSQFRVTYTTVDWSNSKGLHVQIQPSLLWKELGLTSLTRKRPNHDFPLEHPNLNGYFFETEFDVTRIQKEEWTYSIAFGLLLPLVLLLLLQFMKLGLRHFSKEFDSLIEAFKNFTPGETFQQPASLRFLESRIVFQEMTNRNNEVKLAQKEQLQLKQLLEVDPRGTGFEERFQEILAKLGYEIADLDKNPTNDNASFFKLLNFSTKERMQIFIENIFDLKLKARLFWGEYERMEEGRRRLALASKNQSQQLEVDLQSPQSGIHWSVCFSPTQDVAGDFYFLKKVENRLFIAVADVAGKGLPAGLYASRVKASFDAFLDMGVLDLEELFNRVNNQVAHNKPEDSFCTCFMISLCMDSHQFNYCSAGHNNMYYRDGVNLTSLNGKGPPLGMIPEISYPSFSGALKMGDEIFLYSDGCIELEDIHQNLFGKARLEQLLSDYCDSPDIRMNQFNGELREFQRGALQADDITMLSVMHL